MAEINPLPAPQARVWITEFASARVEAAAAFAQLPALVKHPPLDLSDGKAQSAPLNKDTRYIRIVSEVQCAFSTTGTATVDDILVPRLMPEYFGAIGGGIVSVIAAP
jgi:hypothetical protein